VQGFCWNVDDVNILIPRRQFLKRTATASVFAGVGELSFLGHLPRVSAAEARLETRFVRLRPE
jgi:hypothetical protein